MENMMKKKMQIETTRRVDVNKRTVTTHIYRLLQGIKFGHYFLFRLLATSWPKLRFATAK